MISYADSHTYSCLVNFFLFFGVGEVHFPDFLAMYISSAKYLQMKLSYSFFIPFSALLNSLLNYHIAGIRLQPASVQVILVLQHLPNFLSVLSPTVSASDHLQFLEIFVVCCSFGWYFTFVQGFVYLGLIRLQGFTVKQMVNPWRTYVRLSAVLMGSHGLTKGSLAFLNYPAQIMFKSTKVNSSSVSELGNRYSQSDNVCS